MSKKKRQKQRHERESSGAPPAEGRRCAEDNDPVDAGPPGPTAGIDGGEATSGGDVAPSRPTNRRAFLSLGGQILTGLCGAAAAAGAVRLSIPERDHTLEARFAIGRLSDFKMNTLTWLRERELFVMRDEQGVGVFSSRCTHLGCTVQRTGDGFLCPCHGARFDALGHVVRGPAADALPWYRVVRRPDGRLWVHLDEPAPTQGPAPLDAHTEG